MSSYIGGKKNGKMHGNGILIENDGTKIMGEFYEDTPMGFVVAKTITGDGFVGLDRLQLSTQFH